MAPNEKHLEFLQGIIARMASNSFLLKGWSVTLVSALLALDVGTSSRKLAVVAFFPAVVFFLLDGYFLHLERRFRGLYDDVREERETSPYQLTLPKQTMKEEILGWLDALASRSVLWLHFAVLIVVILAVAAL